ncbi:MAG: phosphonate ABC transporter, permease protein PhnE [Eubacteriales bacterium]|nr:phosphonate ABC transporter, permease protein PhnE [Eubacteriales bacterium]
MQKLEDRTLAIQETYNARPRNWWIYTLTLMIVAIIVGWSANGIDFNGVSEKGSQVAKGIFIGLVTPDTSILFSLDNTAVPFLILETMAIGFLGTIIGAILAIPFSFLASENVVPKPVAFVVRGIVLLIRTVPSLVWALVWIRVTGPGAMCGVLTQGICSIGMMCKMFVNAIEDIDTRILESLDAAGCTTFQKIRHGILPQLTANFISTIIYRFDLNIKDATTLGIVGAGGIGAPLLQCIKTSRWSMVGSYMIGLIIMMLIIEYFSTKIRSKLTGGQK